MRKGRNGSVAQCKSATQKRRFVRWVRYCLVGCASQPPFQRKSSSFPGPSSARFGRSPHVRQVCFYFRLGTTDRTTRRRQKRCLAPWWFVHPMIPLEQTAAAEAAGVTASSHAILHSAYPSDQSPLNWPTPPTPSRFTVVTEADSVDMIGSRSREYALGRLEPGVEVRIARFRPNISPPHRIVRPPPSQWQSRGFSPSTSRTRPHSQPVALVAAAARRGGRGGTLRCCLVQLLRRGGGLVA